MTVTSIGKCIGCLKMSVLDEGVGKCCLNNPQRGRVWAKTAQKVRSNPEFAKKVYNSVETLKGKKLFVEMFGLPAGEMEPLLAVDPSQWLK